MQNYFIPHKLKPGDIVHLSDKDSEFVISKNLHKIEDPIEISNLESNFLAIITNIEKKSVEVEIVEKIGDKIVENKGLHITLVQSISSDPRFNFFLEKAVELGVHKIVPVESKFSTLSKNKAIKRYGVWQKIMKEAKEQSRNTFDVELSKPCRIGDLENIDSKYKICFATEVKDSSSLQTCLRNKDAQASYTIAIGPERGWSPNDLDILKNLDFEFVKLSGNILRTETVGLVISSILNFRTGIY
jgi:16S rRNA (uracil1498-N3)-methyltransferase